jgi:hypothetical protein
MALCINQSGTYRNITTLCINQSGTYRNIRTGCINQAGTYRLFGFIATPGALGSSFGGGFLICKPGSSPAWVVSPRSAEVSRTWYLRNDANTTAQQVSGCTGWFVPTRLQLQNPGYCCRSFWGPSPCFSSATYWSSTESNAGNACNVAFNFGIAGISSKSITHYVRAFRCVTY